MKKDQKRVIILSMMVYMITYLFFCFLQELTILSLLKPFPSFLVYYSLKYTNGLVKEKKEKYSYLTYTFLFWFIADLLSTVGEIVGNQIGMNLDKVYDMELILYAGVRVLILISAIKLYWDITSDLNRFQRVADIITTLNCLCASIWIIFVRGRTDNMMDERFLRLYHLDPTTLYSLFYLTIALSVLGVLLIAWFHMKNRQITLSKQFLLIGIVGSSVVDIVVIFHPSYFRGNMAIDMIYKVFLFIIVLAALSNRSAPARSMINRKVNNRLQYGTWRDGFYFFAYPLFTFCIVGFRVTQLLYLLMIAFYMLSCMYVKQIAFSDNLLFMEKVYYERFKLYSSVLEQAPLSIVITDMDGNIQYSNPYFTKISGYTSDEALGKNPRILKSGKTPAGTYEKLWYTVTNGDTWRGDFINIDKQGQEYQENAVIIPIKDEHSVTTHYVAIKENVSETLRIKSQLSDQHYFTSQLLDTIPSAIFYVSEDDTFLGVNAECKKLYKSYLEGMTSTKVADAPWVKEEYYRDYLEMKAEALKNNSPSIRQITRELKPGNETISLFSLNAFYLSDGTLGGFLGVMTDITELKQKEKDLEEALIQANAATEVKSLFLANMSHEIRTPMNAIIGMSYLALKTETDQKQQEYLQYINSAATSLLGIINDILDFSKMESGKMELEQIEFDLDTVVISSLNLLSQKAYEKQLEILYRHSLELPHYLIGDPLRLGQIITNLVSNAIKFTNRGEIEIDIKEETRDANRICLSFMVRDTGIGILEESQHKLFEAFTQSDSSTTRQFGGTGLGLTICQRLVEMMEGKIWVESEFGNGSKFCFTAWFYFNKEQQEQVQIPGNILLKKVLVVDDNRTARDILCGYLEAAGFRVDSSSSAMEALYLIMKNSMQEPYGIIFADMKMPEMDGFQLFQKISDLEFDQQRPVMILMSEDDRSELLRRMQDSKVDALLSKPISSSILYECIKSIDSANKEQKMSEQTIPENDYSMSGKKILLVEDNDLNQKLARELLIKQGLTVDIVNNGKEAVELLLPSPEKTAYDLVLMDLQMPVMDGFEATREIRKTNKDLPIIAMSARTMQEEKNKCFQLGINDHIAKPIDPKKLYQTILKWVHPIRSMESEEPAASMEMDLRPQTSHLVFQGIDTQAGMMRASGDAELYHELLYLYAVKQAGAVDRLREELNKMNYLAIEQYSHMLRGVSGNIGAMEISDICGEIEKVAGTSKEKSDLERLFRDLEHNMKMVVTSIMDHVGRRE